MNPVQQLTTFGQSPWLDFIRRSYTRGGDLQALIDNDGIRGVTSNPAIFEQAIVGSSDYDSEMMSLAKQGKNSTEIYDALSVRDVCEAADLFRPVYKATNGLDGYVSLEVSPLLAHDTEATIADARRLHQLVGRPNVMIKIPATKAGIPAIKQTLTEGININVTLLFSLSRYRAVAEAYLAAMKERASKGQSLQIASVASFFVSRMDSLVDPRLEKDARPEAKALVGKVAVANSVAAYEIFHEIFGSAEFKSLPDAWVQRVLWASTSTKNPAYPKTIYVDSLIGPDTVNTMPLATIEDYRIHGHPADRLAASIPAAKAQLRILADLGYDVEKLADELEIEAVAKFVDPFNHLLASIEAKTSGIASK